MDTKQKVAAWADYLVSLGVPRVITSRPKVSAWTDKALTIEQDAAEGIPTRKPAIKQAQDFNKTLRTPFDRPYLFCIAGPTDDRWASYAALEIFIAALQKTPVGAKPHWHIVDSALRDSLRDQRELGGINNISLLVISGVYANSTGLRLEKVRDLLDKYSDIPRIVVLAGGNPITFCNKVLFKTAHRVMYLGGY